jgi:hypothetical protein
MMFSGSETAWGDKRLEANEGKQLASNLLSPQADHGGPMYITVQTAQLQPLGNGHSERPSYTLVR